MNLENIIRWEVLGIFHGQVVFAEIDPNYRNDFLKIDKYIDDVKPDASGTPKRTKFIATYRVLVHRP